MLTTIAPILNSHPTSDVPRPAVLFDATVFHLVDSQYDSWQLVGRLDSKLQWTITPIEKNLNG
eukprot:scaffold11604_cov63-Skeletonema_menzelii.AAC.1